jgi:hypothetical protein
MVGILQRRALLLFLLVTGVAFTALAQPTISSSTPTAGATGVSESADIVINMSEPIEGQDGSSLGSISIDAKIRLRMNDISGADIPFNASLNSGDDVITINPNSNLPSNTVIYVSIEDVQADSDGDDINPDPTSFTFTTGDSFTPVASFNPTNGASGIAVNTDIVITLDETIFNTDGSVIDDSNVGALIELRENNAGGTIVATTTTIDDPASMVITINPDADLNPNFTYFVLLKPVEDAAGNESTSDFITFTTVDTQAPGITFTPINGATGVVNNADIVIDFDEAVRNIDNSAITNGNVASLITLKLTNAAGADIPFSGTINGGKTQITINPSSNLPDNAVIYVALAAVEDGSDNATTATNISFTTTDSTPPIIVFSPLDNTLDVAVTTNIVISFSEPIRNTDNSAIDNTNVGSLITLKLTNAAGANVPFTATINAGQDQITIDPTSDLNTDQVYYVAILPVEDAANNATSMTSINFTSEDTQGPLAFFNPANGATGVSVSSNIVITFNEPIRDLNDAALDNTTIDGKVTLKLTDATGADIAFNATIDASKTQVTVNPTSNFGDLVVIYVAVHDVEDNFDNAATLQSITFTTTDGTAPVITFNPVNGANTVPVSSNLFINMNELIRRLDNTTFDDTNIDALITLKVNNAAGANVAFDATINAAKTQITVNPNSNLLFNQQYYLAIGPVEDAYNNATVTQSIQFITVNLVVDAGANRTICAGETTQLGGSPTIQGGNGFYNITWSSVPVGFSSNETNPTVSPTVTTTYTCTVQDSSPAMSSSFVTITVNQPTPANQLAIQLNPPKPRKTYLSDDDPVQLTYTLLGSPGSFSGNTRFEGPGVNSQGFFKFFYPNAANIGENVITLFYENAQGCITTKTDTARVVTPNGLISGLDNLYCELNANEPLAISEPGFTPTPTSQYGYRYVYQNVIQLIYEPTAGAVSTGAAYSTSGLSININPGLLGTQVGTGYYYFAPVYDIEYLQYNAADPPNPTVYYRIDNYNFFRIYFFVAQKPKIDMSLVPVNYCENEALVQLFASPAGGTFKVDNSATLALTTVGGKTFFDPTSPLLNDNFQISYESTNSDGCFASSAVPATLHRLPDLNFSAPSGCEGDNITLTPSLSGTNNIDRYVWQFGDRNSSDTIPGSSLGPITYPYPIADNYQVKLRYITNTTKQCVSEIEKTLVIGEIPTINFTWRNVCFGDATTFQGAATNLGSSSVSGVEWDFDGGGYVTGLGMTPSHTYIATGSRGVKFKVNTNKGCFAEIQKTTYTVPKLGTADIPYVQDFNSDDGGWVAGISNATPSSWMWATPTGYKLNGDAEGGGNAWFTGASVEANLHYSLNEKSWVHAPCLNLTTIQRPVLSLDIRTLTQNNLDGVVIQMDSTNLTTSENTWKTVGTLKETANWYDELGLAGNPGLQQLNQLGWSGNIDSLGWKTALIPLDAYLPKITANRSKVRFRIAFGSQGSNLGKNLDGFAFDNFTIKERNRTVLLELFTNAANTTMNNTIDAFTLQPVTFAPKTEIIKLQYHLGTPMEDDIYTDNPEDHSARAIYYGISAAPSVRIDAQSDNGLFTQWGGKVYNQRTLKSAPVVIDTIYLIQDGVNVKVHTEFTVVEDLARNTIVHVALIEKQISANGNNYRYVVRKMLPDATGTKYRDSLKVSATPIVLEKTWIPDNHFISNPNQLAIVVFLQNEDTKEVYQAKLRETPNFVPTLITGTEESFENLIHVYPNPAQAEVNIVLPNKVKTTVPLVLTDNFGRSVLQHQFNPGEHTKTINTSSLAAGVYMLQIKSEKGETARKKIIIVNH